MELYKGNVLKKEEVSRTLRHWNVLDILWLLSGILLDIRNNIP